MGRLDKQVIARIKGGLGNQLFCYAAARRLALVNDAELVIDDVTGFARDRRYRRRYALDRFCIPARKATAWERMEPFERYRRGLAKCLAKRRPFHRRRYLEQEAREFDPRLLSFNLKSTVYLDGYWQSEGYFKDIESVIRTDLEIVPPADSSNREMARRIAACNAVAVHIRWFDHPGGETATHNASLAYYRRAVDEIERRLDDPHFFVFSDDPQAAIRVVNLPEDEATCVSHNKGDDNAHADLWLMTQCRHFIIANSTFSWWGAWLAKSDNMCVIAPAVKTTGITSWNFPGQLPDEWMKI